MERACEKCTNAGREGCKPVPASSWPAAWTGKSHLTSPLPRSH